MNVVVVLTCYNRKEKTERCINQLLKSNLNISFVISDDGSNDGTVEMLRQKQKEYKIIILHGTGDMYYSGGMRMALGYILENKACFQEYDYLLLVNDDVYFFEDSIVAMIKQSQGKGNTVIIGATANEDGTQSYGGIKYNNAGINYRKVDITESNLECDTFNANAVLIPYSTFLKCGNFDNRYLHSLGDFDYGLNIKRQGFKMYSSEGYIGLCDNNEINNTYLDRNLKTKTRILLKENPKGAPFRPWFYFLRKNFGLSTAILRSITPYIKIFLKM